MSPAGVSARGAQGQARLRIATRASRLARWQAAHVAGLLAGLGIEAELVTIFTTGDDRTELPISALGGAGAFVREVQLAVLEGRADLAVHSAKDLPSATTKDLPSGTTPGLVIAAVPARADPRDALVGARLADLAPGATVATGSPRRRAQLAAARPDLSFAELRGNIETRLDRIPPGGAVVVAVAALDRLGLANRVAEVLDPSVMLPQVGQGALAVECRSDDSGLIEALAGIDDAGAHRAVMAERAFLGEIGPGCALPIGAHSPATVEPLATSDPSAPAAPIRLDTLLASFDGRVVLRHTGLGVDPVELGRRLAAEMLASAAGGRLLTDYTK